MSVSTVYQTLFYCYKTAMDYRIYFMCTSHIQVSQQIFSTLKSGVPSSTSASTMALEIRNTFGFEDFLTEFNFKYFVY